MPLNDFDPKTVKDGLDQIDYELHDIDKNIPDEELEMDDNETEELIRANKILRDKVGQIADLVVSAIEKAATLRKQITTHRDQPKDPELNSKLKEINKYQKAIMRMKYPKVKKNYRAKELQDEIKILQAEIEELEEEREIIKRENANRSKAYKNVVNSNKDIDDKVDLLRNQLKTEKEEVAKMEAIKKAQEAEYEQAMEELRKYDGEARALFNEKLKILSGKNAAQEIEAEFEEEEKTMVDMQKKKVLKRLAENKVTQGKMKVIAQRKKNAQLEKELEDVKRTIQEKLEQNEQMSKRAKELKAMLASRAEGGVVSQAKQPGSPKLSDHNHQGEL